jgi:hypothetical protein
VIALMLSGNHAEAVAINKSKGAPSKLRVLIIMF